MSRTVPPPGLKVPRRRGIDLSGSSSQALIRSNTLETDRRLPLVVEPNVEGLDLAQWVRENRDFLLKLLHRHGGVLFRGFQVSTVEDFERFTSATAGKLVEYRERSSPRSQVAGRIYTSTDHPPDQPIFLHNENSYQDVWPLHIHFFCLVEPGEGGQTPIADSRGVFARLNPEIRERFLDKGCLYVRNFGDGFGLPWQTVFQTEDRAEVEAYCRDHGIETEWRDGDRLRTRVVRPAVVLHPETGEPSWFNHVTFFHPTSLQPSIAKALLDQFDEADLPSNTYYGDGTPIESETLDHLREAYRAETVRFDWRQGDVLMLDNVFAAHGRAPFRGDRRILAAMSEAWTWGGARAGAAPAVQA